MRSRPGPTRTVLLVIDADTHRSRPGPAREYDVLRQRLQADVVDRSDIARSPVARVVQRRFGTPAALTLLAARRMWRYGTVYCDSEFYGLLLSLLVRLSPLRTRVFFLAHWPTRSFKVLLLGRLRAHRGSAGILVHATSLQERLVALGVPAAKVHVMPIAVDVDFWSPHGYQWEGPAYVSSAGVELRDYPTLVQALRSLPDVRARLAASSPYSRHGNSLDGLELPANVERVDCDTLGLRDVYEGSALVVVSLFDSEIGAGLTTIAEAMAMGKAVVTSRAVGQSDTVTDRRSRLRVDESRLTMGTVVRLSASGDVDPDLLGPTGYYVPPGDAEELGKVLAYLMEHPEVCEDLGRRGRRVAEQVLSLDRFGATLEEILTADRPAAATQVGRD